MTIMKPDRSQAQDEHHHLHHHQRLQQSNPLLTSSPKPSRKISKISLAGESDQPRPEQPQSQAQLDQPQSQAQLDQPQSQAQLDQPQTPLLTASLDLPPASIGNQWSPAPYGLQNVPRLQPTSSYSYPSFDPHHHQPQPSESKTPNLPTSSSSTTLPTTDRFTRTHKTPSEFLLERLSSSIDHRQPPGGLTIIHPSSFSAIDHPLRKPSESNDHPSIPPSLTLSLFSHLNHPNLSWATKLKSVAATLAINLFLPFMNGIMLGFGEIAARELLGSYFGWGPSAYRSHKNLKRSIGPPTSKSDSTSTDQLYDPQHPLESSSSSFLKPSSSSS